MRSGAETAIQLTPAARELEARWGRAGAVGFGQRLGGTVALLQTGGAKAVVALQGAQVLSFAPGGGEDVLWLSPQAVLGASKPVRGGIPICWPWFGPHPRDAALPSHGFVRAKDWQVAGSASSPGRTRLVLRYETGESDAALWPHRTSAEIEITLGETLAVSLTTDNRGRTPITLSQALHTYLRVGDVGNVSVGGLANARFIDQLKKEMRVENHTPRFDCEIDRIYQDCVCPVIVTDPQLGRRITITRSGSRSVVLWNPWIEKSARLGDMGGEDAYRRMLCVEAANAGNDTVALAPGGSHRLTTEISSEPLPA